MADEVQKLKVKEATVDMIRTLGLAAGSVVLAGAASAQVGSVPTVADILAAATPAAGTAFAVYDENTGQAGIKANGVALVAFRSISGSAVLDGSVPANSFGNFLVATVDRPPGLREIAWVTSSNTLGAIPGFTTVQGEMFVDGVLGSDLEFLVQLAGGNLQSFAAGSANFEIIPIPEPAVAALAGLGSLLMLRRRSA